MLCCCKVVLEGHFFLRFSYFFDDGSLSNELTHSQYLVTKGNRKLQSSLKVKSSGLEKKSMGKEAKKTLKRDENFS